MEEKSIQKLLAEYLDLLQRGKYFVLVPLIIAIFLGTAIAVNLPKVYRAEAKMFYMQAQIPDWAKLEVMNMYLEAMLVFIEAMALTPDNVFKLVKELDLYPELEGRVTSGVILERFRSSYSLRYDYTAVPGKYGRTEEVITGFTFSFDHDNGKKAYYVTNALATSFIKIFRGFREAASGQSSTFFEDERERLGREMSIIDQQISNFKQKHVNELPELFQLNYRMADGIANKLFQIDQKIMGLRSQKRTLEVRLSTLSPVLGMTGLSGDRIVTPQERLAALQAELGQLQARYSSRHPDVRRAQNEIAELQDLLSKQDVQNVRDGGQKSKQSGFNASEAAVAAFNPTYVQVRTQLDEIKSDLTVLKNEQEEYEKELAEYQRRVGVTPLVEKEWLILSRDRESAQLRFNDLAAQVLTMESAAEMEKKELGGRLTIGKPPVVPLTPYKPNIPLIIVSFSLAGLFIGCGSLIGWDYIFKTVRTSHDLQSWNDVNVLVEFPLMETASETSRFRVNIVYVRLAVLLLLIGTVVAVDLLFIRVDVLAVRVFSLIQTKFALLGL